VSKNFGKNSRATEKEKVSMSESMWNTYIVQPFIIWSARQQGEEATVANLGQENTMYYDNVRKKWIDTSADTEADDATNADTPPPIGGYPMAMAMPPTPMYIQSTCRRYRSTDFCGISAWK